MGVVVSCPKPTLSLPLSTAVMVTFRVWQEGPDFTLDPEADFDIAQDCCVLLMANCELVMHKKNSFISDKGQKLAVRLLLL